MKDRPNNLNPRKQNCISSRKIEPIENNLVHVKSIIGSGEKKTSREGGEYFVES